jgi:hypothetical protein
MRVVTRSPLECHQTKKQRLFGGLAMTAARQNKKRRIVRTTSQSLTGNCLRMRPQPGERNKILEMGLPTPSTTAACRYAHRIHDH